VPILCPCRLNERHIMGDDFDEVEIRREDCQGSHGVGSAPRSRFFRSSHNPFLLKSRMPPPISQGDHRACILQATFQGTP